jgi:hypothetical protein
MEIQCHLLSEAPPKALNADLNAPLVNHRTMRLFSMFGQYMRSYRHFLRSKINKQGIYTFYVCEICGKI